MSTAAPESPESRNAQQATEQESAAHTGDNVDILKTATSSVDTGASVLSIEAILSELHRLNTDDVQPNWSRLNAEDRSKLRMAIGQLVSATEQPVEVGGVPVRQRNLSSAGQWCAFAAGIALAGLWLAVFAIGTAVPALPHLEALNRAAVTSLPMPSILLNAFLVILCSTATNPGILACIASLLGGISGWIHVDGTLPDPEEVGGSILTACFASMLRGFFVYLAVLAGLLLLTTDAMTHGTPETYVNLAGTVSVFAFMVGYDPDVFKKLMGKVNGWVVERDNAGKPSQPVSPGNGESGSKAT